MSTKKKSPATPPDALRLARRPAARAREVDPVTNSGLLGDVRGLILSAREDMARAVNSALTLLYWEIGNRIRRDVLQEKRAGYGEEIVATLSKELAAEFGKGFGRRNLFYMVQFAESFPDREIVHALRSQLGWTHFRSILRIEDPLKRDFYAEMCRMEKWNTRTLDQKIDI